MSAFYNRLSYSFGNEDERTEAKALQIEPTNRVFCITASGDRPLHLLLDDPKEIVAIDANVMQNNLFHLKAAAIQQLDYADYMLFIGATEQGDRQKLFEKVAPHLPDEVEQFWRNQSKAVEKGVLWQGAVERLTKSWSPVWRLIGLPVRALFSCKTLEEQRLLLKNHWNHKLWQKIFHLFLHPSLRKIALRDPGLYAYLDPEITVGPYVYQRMIRSLEHTLAKDNALISLIFRGKVDEEAYPPYLTETGIAEIKGRLNRVKTVTGDAIHYLEKSEEPFDRFSFSDIASYLSQADFERMLQAMIGAAKSGARFCIRQCFSGHRIPKRLADHFKRDLELEKTLEAEDRAFVYRYFVGTILKA